MANPQKNLRYTGLETKDAFISYSRRDASFLEALCSRLDAEAFKLWVDRNDISKAADWWKEIEGGIIASDCFIAIISQEYLKSAVCNDELSFAFDPQQSKRVIPIIYGFPRATAYNDLDGIIEKIENQNTQARAKENKAKLAALNWIFFNTVDELDGAEFQSLLGTIRNKTEQVRNHTNYLRLANEWNEQKNPSFLLSGKKLQQAQIWEKESLAKKSQPSLSTLHTEYIRQSEIHQAKRNRNILLTSLITIVIIAGLAVFGINRYQEAQLEAELGLSKTLAERAVSARNDGEVALALALSLDAYDTASTFEAIDALWNTLLIPSLAYVNYYHDIASSEATALAYASALPYIVTGDSTGMIHFWDKETGLAYHEAVAAHDGRIYALEFDAQGAFFFSAGEDGIVQQWDAQSLQVLENYNADLGIIYDITLSPDSSRLVAVGQSAAITVWNLADKTLERNISLEDNTALFAVDVSPDGQWLAITGEGRTIWLWDFSNYEALPSLSIPTTKQILDLAFNNDSSSIGAVDSEGTVSLWIISENNEFEFAAALDADARATNFHSSQIQKFAFAPDAPYVFITGDSAGNLVRWDLEAGLAYPLSLQGSSVLHNSSIQGIIFQESSQDFMSLDKAGHLISWDFSSSRQLGRQSISNALPDFGMLSSEDTKILASSGRYPSPSEFVIIDLETGTETRFSLEENALGFDYSPQSDSIAYYDAFGFWHILNLETETQVFEGTLPQNALGTGVLFSPDGNLLALATDNGDLALLDVANNYESLHDLPQDSSGIMSLAFSPDGTLLLSSNRDGGLKLWSLADGSLLAENSSIHEKEVMRAIFSPNGQYILSGDRNSTLALSTIENGEIVLLHQWQVGAANTWIMDLAISADGKFAAIGSSDSVLRILDLENLELLTSALWVSSNGWVSQLEFAGSSLIAANQEGEILLWDMDVTNWIEQACGLSRHRYTAEELALYFNGTAPQSICPQPE